MSKTIAVLGATGTQGTSIICSFLQDDSCSIRAITRNTASEAAQRLAEISSRIELVQADPEDLPSLFRAFQGCHTIFAVTDYWAPFADRRLRERFAEHDLRRYAFDLEVRMGKNIADVVARTLEGEDSMLESFVWSGLPSPSRFCGYSIYHFESKAVVAEYIWSLPDLGRITSVLYVGYYTSNFQLSPVRRLEVSPPGRAFTFTYRSKAAAPSWYNGYLTAMRNIPSSTLVTKRGHVTRHHLQPVLQRQSSLTHYPSPRSTYPSPRT